MSEGGWGRRQRVGFAALCLLGALSPAGHLLGSRALVGLGFITAASPLPLVFSSFRGVEGFAGRFAVEVRGPDGVAEVELNPALYRQLRGPYNLRNAYGAAIAGAPMLDAPGERAMVESVLRYALCPGGPLIAVLGDVQAQALIVTSRTRGDDRRTVVPIRCEG